MKGVSEMGKHAEGLGPSLNLVVWNLGPLKMVSSNTRFPVELVRLDSRC